jgi:tetratricopeptide (TPR) repeat protein
LSLPHVHAQSSRLPDVTVTADRVFIPAGEVELADGFGASLDVFQFLGRGALGIVPALSYGAHAFEDIATIHLFGPTVGVGVRLPLFQSDNFLLLGSASAGGGPYIATLGTRLLRPDGTPYENQTGLGVLGRAAGQIGLHFNPLFSIEVGVDYGWFGGLAHSFRLRLGASLSVEEFGVPLDMTPVRSQELFPSLSNSYEDQPPVTVRLQNRSRFPMTDLQLIAGSPGVVRENSEVARVERIPPGETVEAPLGFSLADAALTNATERTIQIDLEARAQVGTRTTPRRELGKVETELLGRNALTWTDDRKAASFVDPTGESVLALSRDISRVTRNIDSSVEPTLLYAMAAGEAMAVLGIEYAVDPNLPSFVNSQRDVQVVDYLQYPEDTLRFSSGDCDDMSILYASLLQAAGIPAAFITIPGHLYSAVRLSMTPEEAERIFRSSGDYILHNDRVWLPVETTILDQGFVAAWKTGAEQWRRHAASGDAVLIPIPEAWETYPPAPPREAEERRELDAERLGEAMQTELLRFVQAEFAPSIAALERRIAAEGPSVRLYTNLGVLYAQAGVFDEAEEYFQRALDTQRHPDPLMNLGNIRRLQNRYSDALRLYREAEELRPANSALWLSIALTLREIGDLEEAETYYRRYAERRPASAAAYAYLGSETEGQARASLAATDATITLWETIDEEAP